MTIDEAIKHYEGRASDLCKSAKRIDELGGNGASIRKYSEEHRQLAEWLKELKALKEQEPCEDAISRQAVLDGIAIIAKAKAKSDAQKSLMGRVLFFTEHLPPVTPEPKTGHWIDIMVGDMPAQACDQCKTFYPLSYTGGGHNYCPSCGSRMVEPQESEVQDADSD